MASDAGAKNDAAEVATMLIVHCREAFVRGLE